MKIKLEQKLQRIKEIKGMSEISEENSLKKIFRKQHKEKFVNLNKIEEKQKKENQQEEFEQKKTKEENNYMQQAFTKESNQIKNDKINLFENRKKGNILTEIQNSNNQELNIKDFEQIEFNQIQSGNLLSQDINFKEESVYRNFLIAEEKLKEERFY